MFNDISSEFIQWARVLSNTIADNLAFAVAHFALIISPTCLSISGMLSAVMIGIKPRIVSCGSVSEFRSLISESLLHSLHGHWDRVCLNSCALCAEQSMDLVGILYCTAFPRINALILQAGSFCMADFLIALHIEK